jgi:DNA replication protein DnaC
MNDVIIRVSSDRGVNPLDIQDNITNGTQLLNESCPPKHSHAIVSVPAVDTWIDHLVDRALQEMRHDYPVITTGNWLIFVGKVGRGKTREAWAALRAISGSGVRCTWKFTTAANMFASLRPRTGVDSEEIFTTLATTGILVIDDLGTTKDSTWTNETFDRLVNTRYEWERPTIITTNVIPGSFDATFGERVTSRLVEIATVVPFTGPDLRRGTPR